METSTNKYYNVNVNEQTAVVKYSKEFGDSEITIKNQRKKGYIEINKYDADNTSKKLANIKFGIYDNNNKLIETLTTNSNGYCKSSALDLNKPYYIVKELQTLDTYVLNKTEWKVNLTENGIVDKFVYTLNIANEYKKGKIVIHKVDSMNNNIPIKDVSFKVYDNSKNYITTIKTNARGIATLDNINIGRYILVEESTDEYYILNTQEYSIDVKWYAEHGNSEITITNQKKTGYIEINKYDIENPNIKLANVKFGIYDINNNLVDTLITDSKGYAKSSALYLDQLYIVKELECPSGYVLSTKTWKVNLTEKGIIDQCVYTLNIGNNYKKGNLVVYKVDAADNTIPIENVSFKVYDNNKKYITTIKTNSQGVARLDNININTYILVEESTNEFYRLNTDEHTIVVKWSEQYGDSKITITNEKKTGYIEINKFDIENTKIKLPNVKFGIYDTNNKLLETLTTNEKGYCKSSALYLDQKYIVKELECSDNYLLNETIWNVNLTENGIIDNFVYTLNIGNKHKKGNLYIEKITLDDKTISLGNVEFELYLVGNGETNLYIGTYYTDANGEIYIENLNTGRYLLKETATNRFFYLADDTPIEIKWYEEFGDTNVTIENEKKKGIIKVIKTDKDFSIALENVKFDIFDEDNNFIETITTDSKGVATSSRLRIDKKYHFIESETKNNYILDDHVYTIDFTEGLTKDEINNIQQDTIKTLKLQNQHETGNLVISKVDSLDKNIFIPGVTFELYAVNVDAPYKQNQLIGTYTTDAQGKIEIHNLWTGEYLLKETETDIFYKLNTDNFKADIKSNETTKLTITNAAKRGYIVIEKQDSEFSNMKLEGVVFNIYDEDAKLVETIKTNKNGIATSSLLKIDRTYYILEVSTDKFHILSNEFIKVNFTENLSEKDIAAIKTDIKVNLTIENEAKTSSLEIIKVDKDNNEYKIPDVTFEIYDETLKKVVGTVKTDKNGRAIIDNLKVTHTYSATEKISNKKYQLNDTPITNIVLKEDEITSIKFENEKKKGQVKVIKVDKDNHEYKISDVVFEILDSNKKVIETIKTDKNGEAVSSKLPCVEETYYLREKSTQETYVLSNEIKEITLTENQITNITFENEKIKGQLKITKVDSKDNSIVLEGATFGIYDENDKLVQEIVTLEDGTCLSEPLVIGKYYCKELKSCSPYYLLNEDTYEFEIKVNGEIVEQVIDNEHVDIEVDVDKTGTVEIKPGDMVDYEFSNIANNSNIYLDNFKWFDYIPTDYIRLQKMTTGTWNQDLTYDVYYKTNKSDEYILFKENLSTQENYDLDFTTIELLEDEYIIETCFDFGTVETGFKEDIGPTMQCKSLDTLTKDDVFINTTETIGTYLDLTANAESEWPTIVHVPEEHEETLPKTGK